MTDVPIKRGRGRPRKLAAGEGFYSAPELPKLPPKVMDVNSEEYKYLNTFKINIPELRQHIIELMKDGFDEIPLGDLLFIIWRMTK